MSGSEQRSYIFGAGGHAKVVYDALYEIGCSSKLRAVLDDCPGVDPFMRGQLAVLNAHIVLQSEAAAKHKKKLQFYIAIGNNKAREQIVQRLRHARVRCRFPVLVHPSARVSRFATIGKGSYVGDRAVCEASVSVGKHCIVNTACVLTHDCTIGDFCHIAPGSVLCGRVTVGQGTLIGANCTVLPGISIGDCCTIGAGTVVTRDVPNGSTVRGEPGRIR